MRTTQPRTLDRNQTTDKKSEAKASQRGGRKPVFREMVEALRPRAAAVHWEKAKLASVVRHGCDTRAGRVALGLAKVRHVRAAIALAPEAFEVSIDGEYQIGLISVACVGRGRLHLPASSNLPMTSATPPRRSA